MRVNYCYLRRRNTNQIVLRTKIRIWVFWVIWGLATLGRIGRISVQLGKCFCQFSVMQKKALRCTAEVMIIFVVLSSGRHDVVALWCSRAKTFLDATIVKTNISLRNLAAAPLRVLFFSIIWFVLVLSQENTASKFCFGSNQRKFFWVEGGGKGHHLFYVKSSFHLVPFWVVLSRCPSPFSLKAFSFRFCLLRYFTHHSHGVLHHESGVGSNSFEVQDELSCSILQSKQWSKVLE